MKKLLLGSTALVGAALVSQAALADSPKVTVGGFSDFQAGWVSQDRGAGKQNAAFRADNQISFKVDGKTDSGLGYGGEIWLQADTTNNDGNQGVNASKTFLYVEGMWGRFEGGSNLGADETLKIDASTIARASGGIGGDWIYFATPRAASGHSYIATPDLPLNYGFGNGAILGDESKENINKITYYTPKWYGFQAGVSYAPNDQNRGQGYTLLGTGSNYGVNLTDQNAAAAQNIVTAGLNYNGTWNQVNIGAAATGEWGDHQMAGYHNLSAWNAGAKLGWMGWSLAGSYGDWGKSLEATGSKSSHYWTAGGAYEYGPFGVSLTWMDSNFGNADATSSHFSSWSLGADYKLAPGLTPYVEWTRFDQNDAGAGTGNQGNVVLVGSSLNF